MAGKRTQEQRVRIIEKRENIAYADDDFRPSIDLVGARKRESPAPAKATVEDEDRAISGASIRNASIKRQGPTAGTSVGPHSQLVGQN